MRTTRDLSLSVPVWATLASALVGFAVIGCSANDSPGSGNPGSGGSSTGGSSPSGSGGKTTGSGGSSTGGTVGASGGSGSGGSGGTSGTGGSTSSGGTSASGGHIGTGGEGTGGTGSGGRGGAAGNPGGGGTATGGGSGGTSAGGHGGMMSGGTGGSSAGGAAGKAPVDPSSGCGKTNPQTGSSGSPLTVSGHKYYVKLPTAYDGSKPFPVIFMFNPTNNPISWAEQNAGYEQNGAKTGSIRVYPDPASESNGWGASDVTFFMPLYNDITANFCVDKARVFAAGESSGGDFSGIIGCEYGAVLRAVVPCSTKDVPQYPLDATKRKCTGEVTAIVMQGMNDTVVHPDNGPKMRDFYRAVNHCGMTSVPVAGYTDTLSNCVEYQGCDPGFPVYWCFHTDPNYSGTNHGWPTFAPAMTWGVFSSY